jgi:hypothetical protein
MNNQTNIEKLITSGKKVFTIEDLAVIWGITERRKLIERIKHYLREKRLVHIHKGVYAYGDYTPMDVAQKLVPMSYLSLYTTSQIHGLTFQYYAKTYCIALKSITYDISGQTYVYHKVKEPIFYSQVGLVNQGQYIMADKERTICDLLYVFPSTAFDSLAGVDPKKLIATASIYGNKRLVSEVAGIARTIKKG